MSRDNKVKVGDLIVDKEYPTEPGIIIEESSVNFFVLDPTGKVVPFTKEYIEDGCEVINESR